MKCLDVISHCCLVASLLEQMCFMRYMLGNSHIQGGEVILSSKEKERLETELKILDFKLYAYFFNWL